jgi:hypothetical protein
VTYEAPDLAAAPRHIFGGDRYLPDALTRRINSFGQIVGELNQAPFCWTPTTPNGATGTRIELVSALQTPCYELVAPNDFGQVAGATQPPATTDRHSSQGVGRVFLWTPSAPNSATGTVTYIEQGFGVWALNAWGQALLDAPRDPVVDTEHRAWNSRRNHIHPTGR